MAQRAGDPAGLLRRRSATCRPCQAPGSPASWPTDPQLQVFGEQLKTTEAPPAVPTWEQVAAQIDSLVEQVTKGEMPVDEAVAEMQSKASSIGTGLGQ